MEQNSELVQSGKVLEFLTVANEYCMLSEKPGQYPRDTLLGYMHRILPLLYLKGSLLPSITPPDEDELYERFVTEEQWETSFQGWKDHLGEDDGFWHIPHPHNNDSEKASLAEMLADIYQEMKDFVLLYQKPLTESRLHAIAACRFLFADHWGVKALTAASRVHHVIYPCCGHDHDGEHEHDHK
jgi:hypothetical protein